MEGKGYAHNPLVLEVISKTFKKGLKEKKEALKGVSLQIEDGEIFGLLGPNGAGKSTLVKIALGLSTPDNGKVSLNGHDPISPKARRGVGYLPELFRPPLRLTPLSFMKFMGEIVKGSQGSMAPQEALTMVGLERSAWSRAMGRLSKGMLQRVGLASALVHRPRFLVLDEPLSGLDPIGRHDVKSLLVEFNSKGGTIFLNSHILADIGTLCHRVGILHHGELLYTGTIENLLETTGRLQLEDAFLAVVKGNTDA
jgi:ABC-2 type transport system ATP-binding protein